MKKKRFYNKKKKVSNVDGTEDCNLVVIAVWFILSGRGLSVVKATAKNG